MSEMSTVTPEQYCYFFDDDAFVEEGRPGFRRRVILGERLELWFWRITLSAGDVYLAHESVWHGDSNFIGDDELNEVWILDVFAPPRTAPDGSIA